MDTGHRMSLTEIPWRDVHDDAGAFHRDGSGRLDRPAGCLEQQFSGGLVTERDRDPRRGRTISACIPAGGDRHYRACHTERGFCLGPLGAETGVSRSRIVLRDNGPSRYPRVSTRLAYPDARNRAPMSAVAFIEVIIAP